MFWVGLVIGLFVGANAGFLAYAFIASKKKNGACGCYRSERSEAQICCL